MRLPPQRTSPPSPCPRPGRSSPQLYLRPRAGWRTPPRLSRKRRGTCSIQLGGGGVSDVGDSVAAAPRLLGEGGTRPCRCAPNRLRPPPCPPRATPLLSLWPQYHQEHSGTRGGAPRAGAPRIETPAMAAVAAGPVVLGAAVTSAGRRRSSDDCGDTDPWSGWGPERVTWDPAGRPTWSLALTGDPRIGGL